MRDIRFRGKRKDNGEWVYGCVRICFTGSSRYQERGPCISWFVDDELYEAEVIPETVGQFTGLKDKNGKDGYFGDIVQDEGDRYIVEWDSDEGVAYLEACLDSSMNLSLVAIKESEIIDNVHENSELLT